MLFFPSICDCAQAVGHGKVIAKELLRRSQSEHLLGAAGGSWQVFNRAGLGTRGRLGLEDLAKHSAVIELAIGFAPDVGVDGLMFLMYPWQWIFGSL